MIQVEQLTKRYAGKTAVENISFSVGRGEIVGFLGPNGAGKSTTMRILATYMPPTSGRVRVAGFDVFSQSIEARRHLGYMPEDVPLYPEMRVSEYLRYRAGLKGLSGRRVRERVGEVSDLCSLREVSRKLIGALSRGFRQRVGLADALLASPDLLILDEPTAGLDPNQIRHVRALIKDLAEKHTILLSTHILSEVEMTCGRVIIINKGRIQASDTPQNLVQHLRTAGGVRLEIRPPEGEDAAAEIQKIEGVRDARREETPEDEDPATGWQSYTIRLEARRDLREEIHRLAVERHWAVREISQIKATLEDVFVEITRTD